MQLVRSTLIAAALAAAPAAIGPQDGSARPAVALAEAADVTNAPFWTGVADPAALTQAAVVHLGHAAALLDRLTHDKAPRTAERTLRLYDDTLIELGLAEGPASLISRVPPDASFRDDAQQVLERVASAQAALSLNRAVYDALVAIDLSRADAETKYYVARELRAFRLAGVDRPDAARARLQDLRQQLVAATQEFARHIREDSKTITTSSAALDGLPKDFIARHPADASGTVTLTTGDADVRPVLTYARSDDLRKRMYVAFNTIAYPANIRVLERVIAIRAEIARLAGYSTWAEYDMAPRMAGTAAAAGDFIDRVVAASERRAQREFDALLARKRQDQPAAADVTAWENRYYSELVRRASFDFDSQRLRPYLPFERVKAGLLEITSRLFGVVYRPAAGVPVWHPSVEAYELVMDGRVIGRCYLDLHPRAEKRGNGAAVTTMRKGVAGRQIPEAALVAALPGGQPGDPGLMTYEEVRVFFHEFGHVVQNLLASGRPWYGTSGSPVERDFSEAPSQMFEEWTLDAPTLRTFARHHQTNEPVPADLVEQLRRANEFGQALDVRSQMASAKLSLSLHDRDPGAVDLEKIGNDIQARYTPFRYLDGTHFETRFTHLANANYSASYYTYMWSMVIAKDLFSRFDRANLFEPQVARRYRDTILSAGASKPAAALVEDFLGRPFDFRAWEAWLNAGL